MNSPSSALVVFRCWFAESSPGITSRLIFQCASSTMQGSSGVAQLVILSEDNPRPLKSSSRGVGLGMEKGDGEYSYARNSAMLQGGMLRDYGHYLAEAIHLMFSLPRESQPIRVADFGCSVGANTLAWADLATQSVLQSYQTKDCSATSSPEIQYFFCDISSNDFNTLFRELDSKGKTRPFFPVAVAGSFHDRLFPKGSLHIAISSWSIHWMSKIPEAVQDASSSAYNKGRVWIDGSNPVVAEAYAQVARQDLLSFFTHRAYELAPAGLLFVTCPCRAEPGRPDAQTSGEFQNASPFGRILEDSWAELVAEGVIEPQERDSFNIPLFHPSMEEIEEAVNKTGAYDIKQLEIRRDHRWLAPGSPQEHYFKANPASFGTSAKNMVRAVYNPLVEAHLDPPRAIQLWERFEHKNTVYVQQTQNICLSMPGTNYAIVVLSRQ